MQVPTTETFSSRHKASKDLADGNALLIQKREELQREIKELHILKEAIIEKSGFIPSEYEKVQKEHLSRVKVIEDRVIKARIELGELESGVVDKRAVFTHLSSQNELLGKKQVVLESDIKILIERKDNAYGSTIEAEKKYRDLITEKSKELSLLTDKAEKVKNANAIVSQETESRMASVVEQERLLSIRRTDLEIYETRLRKKYPNDLIIL